MPKVSIIIATHSRPHLLPRAVKSAFEAGTDVEVIVVDDASTDETAAVCKKLVGIKYIRVERNQRTAGARNIGIMAASAPYLGFLDDDDWRLPGSLDKQAELLDTYRGCGLVYGRYLTADRTDNILDVPAMPQNCPSGDIFWEILSGNVFGCLTAIFRKECVYKVGLLDSSLSGIDDWDMWIRIAELYPIMALEEPVAVWKKAEPGSGQGSSDESKLFALAAQAYRRKWLRLPRVTSELGDLYTSKSNELLRLNSERIIQDMAHRTTGQKAKFKKLVAALRCYPLRAAEIGFYKTIARTFVLDRK